MVCERTKQAVAKGRAAPAHLEDCAGCYDYVFYLRWCSPPTGTPTYMRTPKRHL